MAYKIVENNAVAFADNRNIKFPRFQRKQTWKKEDNFKLCISVFKGYPIGVVIVNSQNGNEFLLDGRQRRNALRLMKDDPESVYLWARDFVKFSNTDNAETLKEKFWVSIDEYLQHEASNDNNSSETTTDEQNDNDNDENDTPNITNSYDFGQQYNSLKSLLDLILLCHPLNKKKQTQLQKMYEFNKIIEVKQLEYAEPIDGEYVINHVRLKRFIDSIIKEETIEKADDFVAILTRKFRLTDSESAKMKVYITQHWDYYKNSLDVIQQINDVLSQSSIGMISLTNADVLDAQNIFSLVNHSGTPLSAEELLSARPFWNVSIASPSAELLECKKTMYDNLGITVPEETCRWDACSSFLSRIDKNNLLFEGNISLTTKMSISFRIISALFVGGINNTSVTQLEKCKTIDWNVDIEKLVRDMNVMIGLLESIDYFKYLLAWNQSIMSLTSNSIAIEFCTILFKHWQDLSKPTRSSSNFKEFCRSAVILFDRLVYEYSIRMWTGSGDSTVASHLKDPSSRFILVAEDDWIKFIEEISEGVYKGKPTSSKTLKPFLYHEYFIKGFMPANKNSSTKYEIDHLIAQKFFANSSLPQKYKDNYLNFSILPKGDNIEKTDKKLNEIKDTWLVDQIKKYAEITDEQIKNLSDLSRISELEKRKDNYIKAYTEDRNKLFNNL